MRQSTSSSSIPSSSSFPSRILSIVSSSLLERPTELCRRSRSIARRLPESPLRSLRFSGCANLPSLPSRGPKLASDSLSTPGRPARSTGTPALLDGAHSTHFLSSLAPFLSPLGVSPGCKMPRSWVTQLLTAPSSAGLKIAELTPMPYSGSTLRARGGRSRVTLGQFQLGSCEGLRQARSCAKSHALFMSVREVGLEILLKLPVHRPLDDLFGR